MGILNYRFQLRRRRAGLAGPPDDQLAAEMAVNEVEDAFYYGKGVAVDGLSALASTLLFRSDGDRLWHDAMGADDGSTVFKGVGIVESGSNANGSWIRASGMQICWHQIALGSIVALGAGTDLDPYRTALGSWTFPVAFSAAPPVVTGSARTVDGDAGVVGSLFIAGQRGLSATGLDDFQAYRLSSSNTDKDILAMMVALGTY